MSIHTFDRFSAPILEAARTWRQRCLVQDGSVLSDEAIWTPENFAALDTYFVRRPDEGSGSFYEKLDGQMADAPPPARRLMAEVLWALFLFPSNISIDTKRDAIVRVWSWSGASLDPNHPMLLDSVLNGIGSAGMGVNTNRWREINYIVSLGTTLKRLAAADRVSILWDYDRFMAWIKTVPQDGDRQFRHMLRYFLFPDRVERMSSNRDRCRVLDSFKVAPWKETRKWSDQQLDDALLELRRSLEAKHGTEVLDFYRPPLRKVWKDESEPDEPEVQDGGAEGEIREDHPTYPESAARPINLIFYGPPGTGKTFRIQSMFSRYTDLPADIDRTTWEQELLGRFGWRATIAATLAAMGSKARVAAIVDHAIVRAKAAQRERTGNVAPTIWNYLQAHTPIDNELVRMTNRREPFIFSKNDESDWILVKDWRERDSEAAELYAAWSKGPGARNKPIERYRVVTFHPSYSYEDFVIGLRPYSSVEDGATGASGFRMVDGVFKQICAAARANPGRRYALFIDEINRANIAKVFGELITLIEADKRARYDASGKLIAGMEVQLPGTGGDAASDVRFGVPANLDIYGTMNTADRSIALLDIALRRRFEFEEIEPNYTILERAVEGVHLAELLRAINARLEYLLDRDHRIGHAYFANVDKLDALKRCFERQIIPLLQEYFFDDWSRVAFVLSDGSGRSVFIRRTTVRAQSLFGALPDGIASERDRFQITSPDGWTVEAFRGICGPGKATQPA